jgi:hypothetical protein
MRILSRVRSTVGQPLCLDEGSMVRHLRTSSLSLRSSGSDTSRSSRGEHRVYDQVLDRAVTTYRS